MPKQKSRTRRKAAPQNLVEDVHDLVEEQSQELPPIYRPPVRRRKARQTAPENLSVRETNAKQSSVPTANDIADALFLKFQSSGVQLVKDNTAVPINDLTGILSSSSIQPENSSTTDSQGPMLAVFQPPVSSDPNINTPSDGSSSDCSLVKSNSCGHSTSIFASMTDKLVSASLSDATVSSYNRMLSVYSNFCQKFFPGVIVLPSTHVMVAHFISHLFIQN
ncbi:uncharacterized protein LOC127723364 [Mytilus californianus]|uniref:uncharacterized protein LOC127723364 n=1 Tax=Mytilus californianus TaxID=6549 RepID=UPI002246DB62|nr:uncharacterized protein LOC127723364 [Mytilus californianus]XP_052085906.1 uncharacterized protein LOC127723364 [Mytilus californianus]